MAEKGFNPHYSSGRSGRFWDAINSLPDQAQAHAAYVMGCNLQDIERRTLRYLNELLEKSRESGK